MYHFVLWCTFRDFAVTLSFFDCYRWFSHILNDTLRSVPHTTRCIESQCDYKTVSSILGHSNVATTLNLYVHPNLQQKKRCIDKMSKFVEGKQ